VADGVFVTAGGVQAVGAVAQPSDVFAQGGELGDAAVEVGGVGVEQVCDVAAGRAAALADGDDLPDLGEGQPGGCAALMNRSRVSAASL
jgi:hypothetical protein